MTRSLKEKAISIKGKKYVQVKDRILYFNDTFPNGRVETRIIKDDDSRVVVKAKVTPDVKNPDRYFTGISASNPNKPIEAQVPHEVAETSAVGRALAMMGIGVLDSVASADEMRKAEVTSQDDYVRENVPQAVKMTSPRKEPKFVETSLGKVCGYCSQHLKKSKAGNDYCPCWYR